MANPSSALTTLRPDLAQTLEEYDLAADRQNFIGLQAMPVFDAEEQSGTFGVIPVEQLLKNVTTKRSPSSGYSRSSTDFTENSYATEERGHEEPVDDNDAKVYRHYFDAEVLAASRALDAVLRDLEKEIADLIFNTTTFTGADLYTDTSVPWTTHATAKPINDVGTAYEKVWSNCGLEPNALIMNRTRFRDLKFVDQIKDSITASGAGDAAKLSDITVQMLAQVFDIKYILVAGGSKNTAKEGQDAVISRIWSNDYVMVAHIAEDQDLRKPALGRTFHWDEDGSSINGTVEEYRDETIRSNIYRSRMQAKSKIIMVECGHLLKVT